MVAMVCPSAGGYKICFESPPILLWPIAACQLFLGRGDDCGLTKRQKEFLIEFALWKISQLLASPFRFRSNCDLRLESLNEIALEPPFQVE